MMLNILIRKLFRATSSTNPIIHSMVAKEKRVKIKNIVAYCRNYISNTVHKSVIFFLNVEENENACTFLLVFNNYINKGLTYIVKNSIL